MAKEKDGLGINPNDYRHQKTDHEKTTLIHKNGHTTITIAHNALSKKLQGHLKKLAEPAATENNKQEQESDEDKGYGKTILKEDPKPQEGFGKTIMKDDNSKDGRKPMAEGGKVPEVDKKKAQDMSKGAMSGGPTLAEGFENIKKGLGFDEGGEVPPMLKKPEETDFEQVNTEKPYDPEAEKQYAVEREYEHLRAANPTKKPEEQRAQAEANVASEEQSAKMNIESADKLATYKENVNRVKEGQPQISQQELTGVAPAIPSTPVSAPMLGQAQPGQMMPAAQAEVAAGRQPASIAPQQPPGIGTQSEQDIKTPEGVLQDSVNKEMAARTAEAAAIGKRDVAQAAVYQQAADDEKQIMTDYKSNQNRLEQERQGYMQDMKNGYVDPNKYWEGYTAPNGDKVPGHSRVASAIGLILGGLGGSTKVIDVLHNQIEQSLQSQAKNLNSTHNLLRANLDQFKNVHDAANMTRIMLNDTLQHQINKAAMDSGSEIAKQQAVQANMALQRTTYMQMAPLLASLTLDKLSNNMTPDGMRRFEAGLKRTEAMFPEVAKRWAGRVIPNVGVSPVDVDQKTREGLIAGRDLLNQLDKYREFSEKHGSTLPISMRNIQTINEGKALASAIQNAYRQASGAGVFKQSEMENVKTMIPSDPTAFFASLRIAPKIKGVRESFQNTYNNTVHGLGIKPIQEEKPAQQNSMEGKTATNSKGEKIKMINGKWTKQ